MNTVDFKIHRAIENQKLNLSILGKRKWYDFILYIEELVWSRNLRDGYQIDVYDKENTYITTITI